MASKFIAKIERKCNSTLAFAGGKLFGDRNRATFASSFSLRKLDNRAMCALYT